MISRILVHSMSSRFWGWRFGQGKRGLLLEGPSGRACFERWALHENAHRFLSSLEHMERQTFPLCPDSWRLSNDIMAFVPLTQTLESLVHCHAFVILTKPS